MNSFIQTRVLLWSRITSRSFVSDEIDFRFVLCRWSWNRNIQLWNRLWLLGLVDYKHWQLSSIREVNGIQRMKTYENVDEGLRLRCWWDNRDIWKLHWRWGWSLDKYNFVMLLWWRKGYMWLLYFWEIRLWWWDVD